MNTENLDPISQRIDAKLGRGDIKQIAGAQLGDKVLLSCGRSLGTRIFLCKNLKNKLGCTHIVPCLLSYLGKDFLAYFFGTNIWKTRKSGLGTQHLPNRKPIDYTVEIR